MLGALGDRLRKPERADLEEQLRQAEAELSVANSNLEAAFPSWWADQPETDGGLDEALNRFIEEHNLLSPSDGPGSATSTRRSRSRRNT